MNINKIIDKLTSKIKTNKEKTKKLDKDINNYHLLQLDGIVKTILKHSTYTYLVLTLISIITAKVVGITTIVNTIYPFLIPLVMGSISLSIGTLSTVIKYLFTRKELKNYKNNTNEIKPSTQEMYLRYKVETINDINKALFKARTTLSNNNITLPIPKDIGLEQINIVLEDEYQKLEELTKQHFYLKTKAKNNFIVSIIKAILTVIISFITLILLYSLPLLVVNYSPVLLIPELAKFPFQLITNSSLSTSLYSLSRSITKTKVLRQLKYFLGKGFEFNGKWWEWNPLTIPYKSISKLNKDITAIIEDISNLEIIKTAKEQQLLEQQDNSKAEPQDKPQGKTHQKSIAPRGPINTPTGNKNLTRERKL